MSEVQTLVQRYIETWNETDPRRRGALIAQVFTEDASYTDPLASVRGHDAIDQLVAAAQTQFAGLEFSLGTPIDAHHEQARFGWHLGVPGTGSPLAIGFDVAVMDNGRLREVYGFLDKTP
jgi:SnoaL-like domain